MAKKNAVVETLKKTKRRATEKILQKLGQSECTQDDKDYNSLVDDFSNTHKEVVVLLSKMQLYVEAMERWQKCGESLVKELGSFIEHGKDFQCKSRGLLEETYTNMAETQQEITGLCNTLVDGWSGQVLTPLRDVAFKFDAKINKKIQEREMDKVDFDVYRRRAKTLTPTDSRGSKVSQAQRNFAKLAITQDRFEANNNYLLMELRRMKEARSELVVDEVAMAVQLQKEFLANLANACSGNISSNLADHLEELHGVESEEGKRKHRWILKGCDETLELAGYTNRETALGSAYATQLPPSSSSSSRPGIARSQSARHYVRNAPRNNKQVSLRSIGKQLSLTGLDKKAKSKRSALPDFTLPPPEEEEHHDDDYDENDENDEECQPGEEHGNEKSDMTQGLDTDQDDSFTFNKSFLDDLDAACGTSPSETSSPPHGEKEEIHLHDMNSTSTSVSRQDSERTIQSSDGESCDQVVQDNIVIKRGAKEIVQIVDVDAVLSSSSTKVNNNRSLAAA